MAYTQILYHIIFATKNREQTVLEKYSEELYKFIWGVIQNRKCVLYRINGMPDHLHILSSLHPSICLADFIKDIKTASNKWMKESALFPDFTAWAEGYAAFTYAFRDKELITNYIKNQQIHHQEESFEQELKRLLDEAGITFQEKHLF